MILKFIYIYVVVYLLSINIFANKEPDNINLLRDSLEKTLEKRDYYTQLRTKKIENIKLKLTKDVNDSVRYAINKELVEEYQTFICDSSIVYIQKNISLAKKNNDKEKLLESKLSLAKSYTLSGWFIETKNILDAISLSSLPASLRADYYKNAVRLYITLASSKNNDPIYTPIYRSKVSENVDSLLVYIPSSSDESQLNNIYKLFNEKKYEDAENIAENLIKKTDSSSHLYAVLISRLAYIYAAMNKNETLQKKYLTQAAIIDTKRGIKENSALLNLAIILNKEGEVDKAYNYIKIALEDANFYNSSYRSAIVGKAYPVIEQNYLSQIQKQKKDLQIYLFIVIGLTIILIITVAYAYKQIKIVDTSRKKQKQLNAELIEANRIKEEYIGYFLNQCSIYINKLDEYRSMIQRKIATKQYESLSKLTTDSFKKKDINDFYKNFDAVFLKLYPNFVSEFNKLLKPDEQYKLKSTELNTELRIFALIKLGITDNKQIAEFLRYSIQTVYNYRSKIKSKSNINPKFFEEKVVNIKHKSLY